MKYSEAMEVHRLLSFDVCDKVEEALNEFEARSMMDSFITDEGPDAVTEAFEYTKETFRTLVTWFKNLFNKFVSIMRGFKLKTQEMRVNSLEKKANKKAKADKSKVELSDEEFESLKAALNEMGNPVSISKTMSSSELSALCKAALKKGKETNDALRKGYSSLEISQDPRGTAVTMKQFNAMAKNCGKVIKMTLTLMNKAVKNGMAETKEPIVPPASNSGDKSKTGNSPRLLMA